jgi:tetratricopeptide (TPR) repeat protein
MLLAILAGGRALALGEIDEIEQARAFAVGGKRPQAIALLKTRLASHPTDGDARVLLAIYLSWEGEDHYDEARSTLRAVLARSPDHGDALPALMNVELWDGHPERAEALGRAATGKDAPVRPAVFVAEARALAALNRVHDALPLVERVLAQDPGDEAALALKRRLDERARNFEVGAASASTSSATTPSRGASTPCLSRARPGWGRSSARPAAPTGSAATTTSSSSRPIPDPARHLCLPRRGDGPAPAAR